ncbi:hypothetical protein TKK_0015577 [Trichogramma kaykai]
MGSKIHHIVVVPISNIKNFKVLEKYDNHPFLVKKTVKQETMWVPAQILAIGLESDNLAESKAGRFHFDNLNLTSALQLILERNDVSDTDFDSEDDTQGEGVVKEVEQTEKKEIGSNSNKLDAKKVLNQMNVDKKILSTFSRSLDQSIMDEYREQTHVQQKSSLYKSYNVNNSRSLSVSKDGMNSTSCKRKLQYDRNDAEGSLNHIEDGIDKLNDTQVDSISPSVNHLVQKRTTDMGGKKRKLTEQKKSQVKNKINASIMDRYRKDAFLQEKLSPTKPSGSGLNTSSSASPVITGSLAKNYTYENTSPVNNFSAMPNAASTASKKQSSTRYNSKSANILLGTENILHPDKHLECMDGIKTFIRECEEDLEREERELLAAREKKSKKIVGKRILKRKQKKEDPNKDVTMYKHLATKKDYKKFTEMNKNNEKVKMIHLKCGINVTFECFNKAKKSKTPSVLVRHLSRGIWGAFALQNRAIDLPKCAQLENRSPRKSLTPRKKAVLKSVYLDFLSKRFKGMYAEEKNRCMSYLSKFINFLNTSNQNDSENEDEERQDIDDISSTEDEATEENV